MTFRDLANTLRHDPEVKARFIEYFERVQRAHGIHANGPSVEQVLEAWYRKYRR